LMGNCTFTIGLKVISSPCATVPVPLIQRLCDLAFAQYIHKCVKEPQNDRSERNIGHSTAACSVIPHPRIHDVRSAPHDASFLVVPHRRIHDVRSAPHDASCLVVPHPRIHDARSAPHDARWSGGARLGFLGHRSTYKQISFSSVGRGAAAARLPPGG
jgi:hypothetical protein